MITASGRSDMTVPITWSGSVTAGSASKPGSARNTASSPSAKTR